MRTSQGPRRAGAGTRAARAPRGSRSAARRRRPALGGDQALVERGGLEDLALQRGRGGEQARVHVRRARRRGSLPRDAASAPRPSAARGSGRRRGRCRGRCRGAARRAARRPARRPRAAPRAAARRSLAGAPPRASSSASSETGGSPVARSGAALSVSAALVLRARGPPAAAPSRGGAPARARGPGRRPGPCRAAGSSPAIATRRRMLSRRSSISSGASREAELPGRPEALDQTARGTPPEAATRAQRSPRGAARRSAGCARAPPAAPGATRSRRPAPRPGRACGAWRPGSRARDPPGGARSAAGRAHGRRRRRPAGRPAAAARRARREPPGASSARHASRAPAGLRLGAAAILGAGTFQGYARTEPRPLRRARRADRFGRGEGAARLCGWTRSTGRLHNGSASWSPTRADRGRSTAGVRAEAVEQPRPRLRRPRQHLQRAAGPTASCHPSSLSTARRGSRPTCRRCARCSLR